MFGGIVHGTGRVLSVKEAAGAALRLEIDVRVLRRRLVRGASVSVSGVCLTVVRTTVSRGVTARAWFDVIGETIRCTTLGALSVGDLVNLEGALRLSDEIGGHLVDGHVDGVGRVVGVNRRADETWMTIRAPKVVHETLVAKGYVAVDGASLTVAELRPARRSGTGSGVFSVALIPTTLAITTLATAVIGTKVNLEGDRIGRRVIEHLARRGTGDVRTR